MGKDIIIYFPSQRKAERGGNTNLLGLGSPTSLPFDTIGKQDAVRTLKEHFRGDDVARRRQRWQSKLDLLDTAGKRQRWPRREVKGRGRQRDSTGGTATAAAAARGAGRTARTARWRR